MTLGRNEEAHPPSFEGAMPKTPGEMPADTWMLAELLREDIKHTGRLADDFDRNSGVSWGEIVEGRIIPIPSALLAGLEERSGTDWENPMDRPGADPERLKKLGAERLKQHLSRGRWESLELTRGQADFVRWLWAQLAAGTLRAFGYRASLNAKREWIPRRAWEGLDGIDQGKAWAALFKERNAFNLADNEPAWCDVRIIMCERRRDGVGAELDWVPQPVTIDGVAAEVSAESRDPQEQTASEAGKHSHNLPRTTRGIDDRTRLAEMKEMIETGKVSGPWNAAGIVASSERANQQSSIQQRLYRKYKRNLDSSNKYLSGMKAEIR